MSDPTLKDIKERFMYRDMTGIDDKDVTYLLNRIAELQAKLERMSACLEKSQPYVDWIAYHKAQEEQQDE